jgi:hypothetical protein
MAISMLGASLVAEAQPAGKVYRIGELSAYPHAVVAKERPWADQWAAFVQGLRAHGWIENQNFIFESRYTEGRVERRTQFARELVALRPDVLVVSREIEHEALLVIDIGGDLATVEDEEGLHSGVRDNVALR